MTICSSGHTNPESNKFCGDCGELLVKLEIELEENQEKSDIQKSNLSRFTLIAGIVVIALLGIGYLSGSEDEVKSFGYSNIDSSNVTKNESKPAPPMKVPDP